jgi:transposase
MDSVMVMIVAQPGEMAIFNRDARVERACELIVDAGAAGAGWIIFPEGYLPGGPAWLWSGLHGDERVGELQAMACAQALVIPGAIRSGSAGLRNVAGLRLRWDWLSVIMPPITAVCSSSMQRGISVVITGRRWIVAARSAGLLSAALCYKPVSAFVQWRAGPMLVVFEC